MAPSYHKQGRSPEQDEGVRSSRRAAEAEASYRAALAVEPEHAGAAGNLINLLYVQGKVAKAREALEQAEARKVAIHPGLKKAVRDASK